MDKSSMKPKPIPPPKPPSRLSGQNVSESGGTEGKAAERISSDSRAFSSGDHIYSEIRENAKGQKLLVLKNKTEEEDCNVSAIKSQNAASLSPAILSPKPPLLPKPNASLTRQPPVQPKMPALRPTVPKRPQQWKEEHPETVSVSPHTLVNLKRNVGLTPLNLKAPVAILDEFDCWYEKKVSVNSPVRPPRSPKTKTFVEGPFEKLDIKPELPVKKRWLIAASDGGRKWENAKKKSLSLGRSGNTGFLEDGNKTLSLGRNLSLSEQLATCIDPKIGPVPPPRRRNKSEETPRLIQCLDLDVDKKPQVPIYAAVNYEMKKNRRAKVEQMVLPSLQLDTEIDEVFLSQVDTVVEGRLLLGNLDSETDNNNCSVQAETEQHLLIGEASGAAEINQFLPLHEQTMEVTTSNNQVGTLLDIKSRLESHPTPEEMSEKLMSAAIESSHNCPNDCDEGSSLKSLVYITQVDVESHDQPLSPITSHLHSIAQINSSTKNEHQSMSEILLDHFEVQAPELKGNSSELHRIMSDHSISLQSQSAFTFNDGTVGKETCDTINSEFILNNNVQNMQSFTVVTDRLSKDMELLDSNLGSNCIKCDIDSHNLNERPISTCELPEVSDLVIVEKIVETVSEDTLGTQSTPKQSITHLWRRQSWSSSKDSTPSPERGLFSSVDKHKHQKQQHWYDEGDLSNGALADSDTGSSDNTARLSLEDVNPVRSKISAWFDSFGKGGKKRYKERKARTSSQFFSEDESIQPDFSSTPSVSTSSEPVEGRPLTSTSHKGGEDSESENEDQSINVDNQTEHQRKERKVFFIAQELMTSEREFVDVLKLLNVHFQKAVNAAGTEHNAVIPKSEFSKIINSLPQLQRLNEDLLRDLENRIENWSSLPKIADVIVKKGPFLKLYSSYIQNFESQCNLLDECCQRFPRFARVVKEFESSPCCRKLNVKHFMLKPVQRIPQYRLLLEDYLRHIDVASPDFHDTEEALRIVRDVADHANRSIKLGDHLSKLIELQSQLSNYEIIKPGRQFVKDGELFKLSRKGRHPRFFILLNDCLLYTSKSNTTLIRVNNELPLNGMKVNLPQVEDYRCEFTIISITRSFTLAASSTEERADWIGALQSAIKEHTERRLTFQLVPSMPLVAESFKLGQQAPVWIQDSRVTMCQSCTTQFTVMFRRHHCRACGKVVCGVCSDNRAPLRYMTFHAARVCEECHDVLLQEFEDPNADMLNIIMNETSQTDAKETLEAMRSLFKKSAAGGKKKVMLQKKDIPQRLKEVAANDSGSQMSGWLQRRGRRSWKRLWFVLKEQVLYVYKASEDVVALESIPVLGYKVEPMTELHFQIYEGIDAKLVFQLAHSGQLPLVFHADTGHMANRWMLAMQEATVLT